MKNVVLLLVLIFLCGCCNFDIDNDNRIPIKESNLKTNKEVDVVQNCAIKPIIVGLNSYSYLVGGLINGKMVNYQSCDNYKLFDLSKRETYTIFFCDGATKSVVSANAETTFVSAVGTWETKVYFNDTDKLKNKKYIGINNLNYTDESETVLINDNNVIDIDFDNDGQNEKIIINKTELENDVEIILENQHEKVRIAQFTIDGAYINSYNIFTVDVDEDNLLELIICLYGHSYSTEIFDVTSNSYNKIIWYYMDN